MSDLLLTKLPETEDTFTASSAGLTPYQRRKLIAEGIITVVSKRGNPITVKTGGRGRPATLLKLTAKGRRRVAKARESASAQPTAA